MSEVEVYDEPLSGKDYVLQIKIRNGPLLRSIRMRGFRTATAFAKAAGINLSSLCRYLGLRQAPIGKKGNWSPAVLAMARFLRLPLDSLFPEQHLEHALARSSGEVELAGEELRLLLQPADGGGDPEHALETQQLHGRIADAMHSLPPREMHVLSGRLGLKTGHEQTLQDIADELGVGKERIRQIELRALRRLRHPSRLARITAVSGRSMPSRQRAPRPVRVANSREAVLEQLVAQGIKLRAEAVSLPPHIADKLFAEQVDESNIAVRAHKSGQTYCLIHGTPVAHALEIARALGIAALGETSILENNPVDKLHGEAAE